MPAEKSWAVDLSTVLRKQLDEARDAERESRRRADDLQCRLEEEKEAILGRVRGVADKLSGIHSCRLNDLLASVNPPAIFLTSLVPVRPADAGSDGAGDALAILETRSAEAMGLLEKAKDVLSSVGEKMLGEDCTQLSSLPAFLELLVLAGDLVKEYGEFQVMAGAEAMMTLAMGHGVVADFEKVTGELPRDAQGREVDLSVFSTDARKLAERAVQLLGLGASGDASVASGE